MSYNRFPKAFEHEGFNIRIEFTYDDNYVRVKVFKDGFRVKPFELSPIEKAFYSDCYIMYADFLKGKGYDVYA